MKKIKLLYNPFSGDKSFKFSLDSCINILQKGGYEVHPFRSIEEGDFDRHLSEIDKDLYDIILVSGGDGSVNLVINAMIKYGIEAPIGIIPSGTANDFAAYLKIPKEVNKVMEMVLEYNILETDVGLVNDRYFINVCADGLWANISQGIDVDFKNTLGKLAYYIKGIEQLPNFMPMSVRITTSTEVIEESIYLFIVLNSSGTGGFENLSPSALISDGLLDLIAIKEQPFPDLAKLLVKVLARDFLALPGVIYLKDKYFKIESLAKIGKNDYSWRQTDIDGETGPELPVEITVLHKKMKFLVPTKKEKPLT